MTRTIAVVSLFLLSAAAHAQTPPPPPPSPTPPPPPAAPATDPLTALKAASGGLTADEVGRRASETSVEARVRERAVDAAEARQQEAEAGYWPRLIGTARYTRLSQVPPIEFGAPGVSFVVREGDPGIITAVTPQQPLFASAFPPIPTPVNQYTLQVSLTVPLSDYVFRVSQAIAAATHSARAARVDEQAARLKVAAEARVAFYQWIRARGQAVIAAQALEQARAHLRDAQQMFAAGVVSRADTLRAESQVKSIELLQTRTLNLVDLAEEQLHIVMHDPGARHYEVGEDVTASLPARATDASLTHLQDEAFDHRLELRALDETAGSVRELAKVSRAAQYPRLDLAGNAIYANPNQRIFPLRDQFDRTWDATVQLSWTPTDIAGARAAGRAQAAQEGQILAQREALLDGLRLEVTQAYQLQREAEVALGTTLQGLLAAEESARVRRDLFRNGKATLVEVNDAESELTRSRLEVVNAHIDARIARVRLDHAVGRDATGTRL
ncbi:MAG TPA: TolC family protein [Polyangia bacterium]|nr:TolC family protein [Polyangia bacterium]